MAFEMQYKDDIQKRMANDFEKVSDKADYEGSFSRDLINANSIEFEKKVLLLIRAGANI